MKPKPLITVILLLTIASLPLSTPAAALKAALSQSADAVEKYDFLEVALNVENNPVTNPFTDVQVSGQFKREGGDPVKVDGFCDSLDGSVYRIRFMPTEVGAYAYSIALQSGNEKTEFQGQFEAKQSVRRGLVQVDKDRPWHFVWQGSGEHFFWNGTTTYWLLGWNDENIIKNIDRLDSLKVNYLRVAICGRVKNARDWKENVFPTKEFSFLLNPWVAENPDSVEKPGFDVTRFNAPYWQKIERLVQYAREKDVTISIIFYVDGAKPGVEPFKKENMGNEDEQRYYRYAVARLAPYSNVLWDITNEYQLFRTEEWVNKMGTFLDEVDPYDHLISVHGHGKFPFRTEKWADFAMYQAWDKSGAHGFMLNNRREQEKTGRPIPQVNEEYGYEDHYPNWGNDNVVAPARSADNRRRLAWEMYMAGGYQTTGERADAGTGWGPDTGGGWVNGRGDNSMTMLIGYGYIMDFFKSVEWWKTDPHDELVTDGAMCLADPGNLYIVYLPQGGHVKLKAERAKYEVMWFDPRSGKWSRSSERVVEDGETELQSPDNSGDWVVKLVNE